MPANPAAEQRLLKSDRILLAGTGVVLLVLLFTARCLNPSPVGIGTHQQLGLPPCSFLRLTQLPCPGCGMTTSWAYFTRGDFFSSATVNPGGTMLAMIAVVAAPWLLCSGVRGRWLFGPLSNGIAIPLAIILPAVIVVSWVLRVLI